MRMKNQASDENGMFPKVSGKNLLKEKIVIPTQLRGKLNIVIVAFQQWHQKLVDSWIPFLENISHEYHNFEFYELPTIQNMNFLYRMIINNGMRFGIQSKETRGRTITLYIDKPPFKCKLGISNEKDIHIFLIDREGHIYWKSQGPFDDKKGKSLLSTYQLQMLA
ncbi:MAG: hypothetical protein PVG65_02240 [Candidatus Thorarchaeota archaeon]|jgi:hypothetical protein